MKIEGENSISGVLSVSTDVSKFWPTMEINKLGLDQFLEGAPSCFSSYAHEIAFD